MARRLGWRGEYAGVAVRGAVEGGGKEGRENRDVADSLGGIGSCDLYPTLAGHVVGENDFFGLLGAIIVFHVPLNCVSCSI